MNTPERKAREFVGAVESISDREFTQSERELKESYFEEGYRTALYEALTDVRKLCNVRQVIETLEGKLKK